MMTSPCLSVIFFKKTAPPSFRIMRQPAKKRHFIGYPMAGLTERARRNMSLTYPVVI